MSNEPGPMAVNSTHNDFVRGMLRVLDIHAPGERAHAERVAVYAVAMGERLGLEAEELLHLRRAAQLHDIGKLQISSEILTAAHTPTDEEWTVLRSHPAHATSVLAVFAFMADALPAIRHHQERWDGKGYPDGLQGDAIPLHARLISVAEAYDRMVNDMPYRQAISSKEARSEIQLGAGTQFDPSAVAAFEAICDLVQPIA